MIACFSFANVAIYSFFVFYIFLCFGLENSDLKVQHGLFLVNNLSVSVYIYSPKHIMCLLEALQRCWMLEILRQRLQSQTLWTFSKTCIVFNHVYLRAVIAGAAAASTVPRLSTCRSVEWCETVGGRVLCITRVLVCLQEMNQNGEAAINT